MKFYEKYYASSYEELITYYPRFYRDVYEMVEILKAQGRIADALEDDIEQTYLNNFILTADLATVKIWEGILGITHDGELTLEQRRQVVIGRLGIGGYGHIGEPEIRDVIAHYTENAVAVDFALGVIYIVIEEEIFDEANLLYTLLHSIPAHLALDMRVHVERTFRQEFVFGFAGAVGANFDAPPVAPERVSEKLVNGASGLFYHTRIKSTLIG